MLGCLLQKRDLTLFSHFHSTGLYSYIQSKNLKHKKKTFLIQIFKATIYVRKIMDFFFNTPNIS